MAGRDAGAGSVIPSIVKRWWRLRRYWRHLPVIRWWSMYVRPDKCLSCGRRWRDHAETCYFA